MQGVYVDFERADTKKALSAAVAEDPTRVTLEATSFFGNEYDGPLSGAPDGTYSVVGPDPQVSRKWYATIEKSGGEVKVS